MKIYFAGISGNVKRLNYLTEFGASKLMLTYADIKFYNKQMPRFKNGGFDILLDSGAFSIWKRGFNVDILDYVTYIEKHDISKYIVLDVIGDHEKTMENQKIMEELGLNPIPVFHMTSPILNLGAICEIYPYVCLGGTVGSSFSKRVEFFKRVFDAFPSHKFHGLGLTDSRIMKMFPFYSVDSTTWLVADKCGKILDNAGKQIRPPQPMDSKFRFENTIKYFVNLENE